MSHPSRLKTVPDGFNKAVMERMGCNVSKSHVTAVRKGQRRNDAVLLAIIEVDHYWQQIQHERLKKLL